MPRFGARDTSLSMANTEPQFDPSDDDADIAVLRDATRAVTDALESSSRADLLAAIEDVHPADIADLLEQLPAEARRSFVQLAGDDLPTDILAELEEGVRDDVVGALDDRFLAEAVGDLDTDDAVYLLEDMDEGRKQEVLDTLPIADRVAIERSLDYPDYSAGRMMQRDLVAAPAFWTVGQTIDMMRSRDDLPEDFYEIIVVDPSHRPIGTIGLARIMGSKRPATLDRLMDRDFRSFSVIQPQEDVAYAFNQYHLVSAPVLDETGRLAGVITIDDAMQVLDEETEEDLMRLGGVGDEDLSDTVLEIAKQRLPWLAVNLATAIIASLIIAQFDMVIEQIVALAVLMTIVASMGGNAGTQTLTVAVRALATKDLTSTNALRIVTREGLVGLLNGAVFAVVMGGATWWWYSDPSLGIVLGVAMIINMFVAALAGILVPIGLEKVGADPALASAVFVTTVTDVVGFFAFLGLAAIVLL